MRKSLPLIQLALLTVAVCVWPRAASAQTIVTCVSSSGSISVTATGACGSKQQLVVWNIVGSQGSQGPAGPSGASGPIGPSGIVGTQGSVGPLGAIGLEGSRGAAGAAGPSGDTGSPGVTGPVGEQGAQGPAGPAGPVGVDGPVGVAGEVGAPGDPDGPAGLPGEPGPSGAGLPLVYDANGLLIGKYFDNGAIVTNGDDQYWIGLERLGYTPLFGFFYYFTPDCSDAPYGRTAGFNIVPPTVTAIANGVAWVPQLGEASATILSGQRYYTRNSAPFDPHADLTPCTEHTNTSTFSTTVFPYKGYDISAFAFPFRAVAN